MIPASGSTICQTFQDLAAWTWDRRARSEAHNLSLGEETLTDIVLLELKDRHPAEVQLIKFNRRQEAWTGADWEWWLTDGNCWFGMLIQAKKLYLPARDYPMIFKTGTSSPTKQFDRLTATARSKGITPLYCFYNFVPARHTGDISWQCGSYQPGYELFGCSIAHAQAVRSHLGKTTLKNISPISLPWHCLVCCPVHATDKGMPRSAHGVASMLGEFADGDDDVFIGPPTDAPPEYIGLAMDVNPESFSELEPKIREMAGPLGGIVIIKE